jgi:hypothetical protein
MTDAQGVHRIKSTRQLACKRLEKGGVVQVVVAKAGERGPNHRKALAEVAAISARMEATLEFCDEDA